MWSAVRLQVLMEDVGWDYCYWCWKWKFNMNIDIIKYVHALYVAEDMTAPLCGRCFDLYINGEKPPWQPDARARLSNMLQIGCAFPENAAELVAQFTHEWCWA